MLTRINNFTSLVEDTAIPVVLFANNEVPIDKSSIKEVVEFTKLADTISLLRNAKFFGDVDPEFNQVILTPDFHRGAGIPVGTVFNSKGFVLPRAVGNDIGCGMRLTSLNVTYDEINSVDKTVLDNNLRHIFFEGGRDIPLTPLQRAGLFRYGLLGLDPFMDTSRVHMNGTIHTDGLFGVQDFVSGSSKNNSATRDDQIGSIGGGNHFVELQYVSNFDEPNTAYNWGLRRNYLTIMAHSGSVGIGHIVGSHFMDLAKKLYPKGIKHPDNGFYVIPTVDKAAKEYLSAMGNAANFAFGNRYYLTKMAIQALEKTLGRKIEATLVYDAPHNLIWQKSEHEHLHRKGACPAELDNNDPVFPNGHPVIIPGSMGDKSYLLRGLGQTASLCSACHGAGRIVARGTSRKANDDLNKLRIISKINPNSYEFRKRPDIVEEYTKNLMEEAPSSYKPIDPVISTVVEAKIAAKVATLKPILTIKG